MAGDSSDQRFPDLCTPRALLAIFLGAELVVLITLFVPARIGALSWESLALRTLFAQWVALCAAAALCSLRPLLQRLAPMLSYAAAWVLVLLICAVTSAAAFWLDQLLQLGMTTADDLSMVIAGNVAVTGLVTAGALRYLYVQSQWRRSVEAQATAQLEALQARIRPHFLFNSLNTIASLTRHQPERAEAAVEDLSDLLRATLGQPSRSTLGDELALCRRYLALEELRLGKRLQVQWAVDDLPAGEPLPPLLLQPLVENAVNHGIAQIAAGGTITLRGGTDDRRWWFEVVNPLPRRQIREPGGSGMALANVAARVEHAFGERGKLDTRQRDGHYVARLEVPRRPNS